MRDREPLVYMLDAKRPNKIIKGVAITAAPYLHSYRMRKQLSTQQNYESSCLNTKSVLSNQKLNARPPHVPRHNHNTS